MGTVGEVVVEERQCTKCSRSKPLCEFDRINRRGREEHRADCKVCRAARAKDRRVRVGETKHPQGTPSEVLSGRQPGGLTVMSLVPGKRHRQQFVWLCQCVCGGTLELSTEKAKVIQSCGCLLHKKGLHAPTWRGVGDISGTRWSVIRACAKARGHKVDVTKEYCWALFLAQGGQCVYTGIPLTFGEARFGGTASLDRIDSSQDYVPGNVQWVHKTINRMKLAMTHTEFVQWCSRVAAHAGPRA